jgi:putative membrane protein
MRWAWIGIGVIVLIFGSLLLVGFILRFSIFPRYYGMPMMGGAGMLFGLIGFLFLCFLIFTVFRFAVWGSMGHRSNYRWNRDDAEEILRQRYARGEITKEQFDLMLRDLRASKN